MLISRFGNVATIAFAALMASTVASFGATPGSVNPSRAGERLAPQKELPSVGAPIAIPSSPEQKAPADSDAHRFTLSGVSFEGNVALSDDRLQTIAKDYIGKEITLAQVYQLASKVTAAYRSEGYILARAVVPTQTIGNGVLNIKVIEGFIDKVKVEGDAGGARSLLEEHGKRIAAIRPLTSKVLERELLLAQDLTGFRIRSVLTPSATTPGAADLTMLVERDPFDAYLGADNLGSRYLGPYEITGAVFANDVFSTAGRLGLMAVVTPDDKPEMAYGAITYNVPLNASGLRLYALASHTETEPGDILATLGTKGRATTLEADLSYPVIRSRDLNLVVSGGIASRDSRSQDDLISPLYNDHVRAVDFGVQANALDTWGGYSTLNLNFTQGLDAFGATTSSDANKSRVNADGQFSRLNLEVTHLQPLITNVSLLLGATGQTSFGASLLSSEQFGLGGTYYGRGFDPSELTGDKGLAGKAELRWDAYRSDDQMLSSVQLYTFYEGGTVWLESPLPGEEERSSLASAGIGARLVAFNSTNISVEFAQPLTRDVAAEGNRDGRVYFTIGHAF
jgi:hemolysin activation/secretion protein